MAISLDWELSDVFKTMIICVAVTSLLRLDFLCSFSLVSRGSSMYPLMN